MFQFTNAFNIPRRGLRFWRIFALAALVGWHAPVWADTVLTSASVSDLRIAMLNGGTITLAFDGTLTLTNTLVVFVNNTVIDATGHSVTIDGNSSVRIFDVPTNIAFKVINLTLSDGKITGANGTNGLKGSNGGFNGGNGGTAGTGANGLGGAIRNLGNCTLDTCILTANTATGGAGGTGGTGGNGTDTGGNGGTGGIGGNGYGGAVYNLGTLLLTNCTIAGNTATGGNGGAGGTNGTGPFQSFVGAGGAGAPGAGAGLYNLGTATILGCTFNQNSTQAGSSQAGGGSPAGNGNGPSGPSGPDGKGGGICNLGTETIINCTFDLNQVTGGTGGNGGLGTELGGNGGNGGNGYGGNLYNEGTSGLTNCSIANGVAIAGINGVAGPGAFAGNDGQPGASRGDNIASAAGTLGLKNSLLAYPTNSANAYGTITDLGNNISSDNTPAFTKATSKNNLDPQLLPLDGYGGPTLTMALFPGSLAIDAGDDAASPAVDQRGVNRPVGPHSDIGAYEAGASFTIFSIQGHVMMGAGPFAGVTIKAGNASTLSGPDGFFSFNLPAGSPYTLAPQPQAYFNPSSAAVVSLTNNVSNLVFTATNFVAGITNSSNGSTNTNSFQISFSGIPNFKFRIQATTNLASTNLTNWVTIATNTFDTNGLSTFTFFNTNTFFSTNISTNLPQIFFRTSLP